jgi:hypothetical protein
MMDEADKKKFQNAYDDASPAAQEKIQAVMREYGITHRELTEEESDQAGQKIADILRNDKAQREGQRRSLTSMLRILRENGWTVGVHNDYRQGGKLMTFWLFTHPSGRWLKGEGESDENAVFQVYSNLWRS